MQQTKISLDDEQIKYINMYRELGFKDKSSLVRSAVQEFIKSLEKKKLEKSANLYAEMYEDDSDSRDLTNSAIEGWPNASD